MTITVTGKFYQHDDCCSYSEWDWVPFDECDNDDDNMFNALLFAHQTISNGDAKWVDIGDGVDDDDPSNMVDFKHDVLNHMMFWEPQSIITDDDWDSIVVL